VLIIHSVEDEIVNIRNAKILYDAIPHNRKTVLYIKGGHSAPDIPCEAFRVLSVFLRARVSEPYLATHTQVDKMDRVISYYNHQINSTDSTRGDKAHSATGAVRSRKPGRKGGFAPHTRAHASQ